MKLAQLHVSNFKRIRIVDLNLGDGVTILGGDNGAGKSSILDAIAAALLGGKAMPDKPVRTGADNAEVSLTLDNGIKVKRVIKPDGSTQRLEVTTAEGMRPDKAPQAWLDAQLGAVSFDPMAFLAGSTPADDRRRADTLRALVGLDLSPLDAERDRVFAERRDIGRDRDIAQGAVASLPPLDPTAPDAEQSSADALAAVQDAQNAAQRRATLESQAREYTTEAAGHTSRIAELTTELEALEPKLAQAVRDSDARADVDVAEFEQQIATLRQRIADRLARKANAANELRDDASSKRGELELRISNNRTRSAELTDRAAATVKDAEAIEVANIEALSLRVTELDGINRKVRANAQRKEAVKKAEDLARAYTSKSDRLDAIAAERKKAIAAKKMPVEGLGFDEAGVVTFAGVPLSQSSQAERMRVSMAIGLAANPKLRLVMLRDASLLDRKSMAMVAEMARAADAVVLLERVGDGDAGSVVIEDGEVRAEAAQQQALAL